MLFVPSLTNPHIPLEHLGSSDYEEYANHEAFSNQLSAD
jgi:hypothetical protein